MSIILTYRPRLRYQKQLAAILIDREETQGYRPPAPIQDYIRLSPVNVLENLYEAQNELAFLSNDLKTSLAGKIADAPTIDEYIKGKEENDYNALFDFEDYHSLNIQGNTAAEMVPIIDNLEEEISCLIDFFNTAFFNGEASEGTLDDLHEQEEKNLSDLMTHRNYDLDAISEDNHLTNYLNQKADMAKDVAAGVEGLLSGFLDETYTGSTDQIGLSIVEAPNMITRLKQAVAARFTKHTRTSEDAKQRMKRVADKDFKCDLLNDVRRLQQQKLDNRLTISWVEEHQIAQQGSGLDLFHYDLLEGVQESNSECEDLLNDLYKMITLDQNQYGDYMEALQEKKACRDLLALIEDIEQNYDFDSDQHTAQISQMIGHLERQTVREPRLALNDESEN